ncbi:MAG TPA: response regulator transcription factor [Methyloceanibacter sp.]
MTQVLVIDDHPIVLEGCRQLLKFAGVKRIVQTQSLADGFRLYRSKKPDLIIVDLAMRTGALGGLSFIRRLRLHDTRTPILVFSMHNDPFIVSRALKIGALHPQGHAVGGDYEGLREGARRRPLSQP